MTAARLAARCVDLLGAIAGPLAIVASPTVRAAISVCHPVAEDGVAAGICVLTGEPVARRGVVLDAMAARLPEGAPLVVVDYNQPRTWWRRVIGAVTLALHGHSPARAREPVARDVQTHGFTVERLCLEDGERLQLIVARRR